MSYIKIMIEKNLPIVNRTFSQSMDSMFRMNHLFALNHHAWCPHTDIIETEGELMFICDLAGVKLEDIHVETDRRTLVIYGIRRERQRSQDGSYLLAEIPTGYFERFFSLSTTIDTEAVQANYADGLLQIHLKKLYRNEIQSIAVRIGN